MRADELMLFDWVYGVDGFSRVIPQSSETRFSNVSCEGILCLEPSFLG